VTGAIPCVPVSPALSLDPLEAWSINYANDWTCPGGTGMDLEFMGPFTGMHTGAYSTAFGYGAAGFEMWNMFANPYPSGLAMDLITWDPGLVQGAAYYDGCAGGYVYWTPALGPYTMAPGLGFFTEATAPGTFALTGAERAHGADWWWKSEVTELLTLQVSNNEYKDVTHIRFMENASPGFETTGDFHKLFSEVAPQIYTVAGEDMLAVNVLPATKTVPMGFTCTVSGTYTIEAIETSEFAYVVLEDKVTGIQTDLLVNSYTFDYTAGGNADRFNVHFAPLGTPELNASNIMIYSNQNNIYVNTPVIDGDIVVYNMMGQEIIRVEAENGMNVITMDDVDAYYIVKVVSSTSLVTEKVYVR
jgi:hypothetical protein